MGMDTTASKISRGTIRKRLGQLRRFSRYIYPYWDKQVALYIGMGFSALLGLANPYLSRLIIDYALLGKDLYLLHTLVLVGVVIYLFSIPIELLQKNIGFYVRTRVSFALRSQFYRHLHRLSLRFAQSRPVGEHLYRMGPDLEGVASLVVDTIPSVVILVFRLTLLLGICLWLDWKLTMVLLAVSPLIYFHTHYFSKRQYALGKEVTERNQEVSSQLQEAMAQIRLIKIFGKERTESNRYLRDIISLIRLNIRSVRLALMQTESGRFINAAVMGGLAYFLGYQVIKGRLSLGELTALTMYLLQLLSALKSIGGLYNDMVVKFIAMDRVLETLDAEVEVKEDRHPVRLKRPRGEVKFDEVTFGYQSHRPVLRGVSFQAEPGETVALVGESGVGKTTLVNLLLRLYSPWGGRISIDGHDIRELRIKDLRRVIGFSSHEPSLLKGTIRENIVFGNPEAPMEQVIAAAEIAEAHDFIMELPLGYDTQVGETAHALSQGQRQRIAIARAVAVNPRILVLDEAMSSLSSDCEGRIVANLNALRDERVTLIISHRLSAVRMADRIIVLHQGMVGEAGTHEELVNAGKLYYRLYGEQLQHEVSAAPGWD
jgi:ABC-type bacteriocin/lantibiotic exporter with double-glycine peptidase domain